jgi:cell wall-associated NlpC family hydrolase
MLVEHPDVVQTCVVQAGNAWVSPDLVEKEPRIFDPEVVAREDPLWMEEMITLHSPTHGPDYWRDLLAMTVKEIISEPNYTPGDLQKVERPALIVQGEFDRVNAFNKHAQFIARHVPAAELWIPPGIGHNVHDEILKKWIEQITDFFARRDTAASDRLFRYKLERHEDERNGIFDVRLGEDGILSGTVLTEKMHAEALSQIKEPFVSDQIKILLKQDTPWALLNRPVEDLRRKPSIHAERVSQARMGETARVLESNPEWSQIRLEHDGYIGWVHTAALFVCGEREAQSYQDKCNAVVMASLAEVRDDAGVDFQKIPFATLVSVHETSGQDSLIQLPDGRTWRVKTSDLLPIEQQPRPTTEGITRTLNLLRRFVGVPYLWGGRTPYGFDCSGLVSTFYDFMGVTIPRDADQQFQAGTVVEGKPQPGDLLFFGEDDEDVSHGFRITHVAILLGGDEFIHANGTDWGISCNSFDPGSPRYGIWLRENYRGARRFR